MRRHVGMMPLGKITKQQRQQERLHLGKLEDLVVKKATLAKYHTHFNRFMVWAEENEFSLRSAEDTDATAATFIESLYPTALARQKVRTF